MSFVTCGEIIPSSSREWPIFSGYRIFGVDKGLTVTEEALVIVNKAFLCADIYFSLTGWNYLLVARHFCAHTRVFLRLTDIFKEE